MYPKWDCKCYKDDCGMDYWQDMGCEGKYKCKPDCDMSCEPPTKMLGKVEKECVKTFKCVYKLYKVCTYRLCKVCPCCGHEFDYHHHRGVCPHCHGEYR